MDREWYSVGESVRQDHSKSTFAEQFVSETWRPLELIDPIDPHSEPFQS